MGVMHFFTGTQKDAEKYLALGLYLSFSGVLTFTHDYDELVRWMPLEKILVETDAPFVAPAPHRGKETSRHMCNMWLNGSQISRGCRLKGLRSRQHRMRGSCLRSVV